LLHGQWVSCAIDGTTSAVCDLGRVYEKVCVLLPTLSSDTCKVQGSKEGTNFYDLYTYNPADGHVDLMQTEASGDGDYYCIFPIGGFQFLKFVTGKSVTDTFYARGVRS